LRTDCGHSGALGGVRALGQSCFRISRVMALDSPVTGLMWSFCPQILMPHVAGDTQMCCCTSMLQFFSWWRNCLLLFFITTSQNPAPVKPTSSEHSSYCDFHPDLIF
jgi:hypothetical protein